MSSSPNNAKLGPLSKKPLTLNLCSDPRLSEARKFTIKKASTLFTVCVRVCEMTKSICYVLYFIIYHTFVYRRLFILVTKVTQAQGRSWDPWRSGNGDLFVRLFIQSTYAQWFWFLIHVTQTFSQWTGFHLAVYFCHMNNFRPVAKPWQILQYDPKGKCVCIKKHPQKTPYFK